jgi:hypothetical protein
MVNQFLSGSRRTNEKNSRQTCQRNFDRFASPAETLERDGSGKRQKNSRVDLPQKGWWVVAFGVLAVGIGVGLRADVA